jgi:ubiquinone/menaquinone biosynthesis C-methylase UbiE
MFNKEDLRLYFKNKVVYDLVFKVIDYNFNNPNKTKEFMILLEKHLSVENLDVELIQSFLKQNNLGLCQEESRVNDKINELNQIIDEKLRFKPTSVLDIGVGNGNILKSIGNTLSLDRNDLFGIDVVDYSLEKSFTYLRYDCDSIPLEDNSVQLILLMMMLHHTDSPLDTLKEAHRVLSSEGSIVVRETNAYCNDLLLFNILMEYVFYTILLDLPINITKNYFSVEEWEDLFMTAGFKYERLSSQSVDINPFTPVYYKLTK